MRRSCHGNCACSCYARVSMDLLHGPHLTAARCLSVLALLYVHVYKPYMASSQAQCSSSPCSLADSPSYCWLMHRASGWPRYACTWQSIVMNRTNKLAGFDCKLQNVRQYFILLEQPYERAWDVLMRMRAPFLFWPSGPCPSERTWGAASSRPPTCTVLVTCPRLP